MSGRRHLSVLLGACCLALLPGWALAIGSCERLVATGVGGPPYLWQDPQNPERLIGASAELLQRVTGELGLALDVVHAGNAQQAEQAVASGRIDVLIGTRLELARLERMDFIHPALHVAPVVVWVAKGRDFPYQGWEDLRGRQGVRLAEPLPPGFERLAASQLKLEEAPSLSRAMDSLLQGRSEYLLHEHFHGQALALRLGLVDGLEVLEPPIASHDLYIALSHSSVCNEPWLRGQLARKLTELSATDAARSALQDHLRRWASQQVQMDAEVNQ